VVEKIKLYKVVGKPIPITEITPEGEFVEKIEIFFETVSGVRDSIKVRKEADIEERKKLLHEAALLIEETLKLRE